MSTALLKSRYHKSRLGLDLGHLWALRAKVRFTKGRATLSRVMAVKGSSLLAKVRLWVH